MRFPWPATLACTGRKLMFQRRLVTLCAWLMRFPACGFLPQMSHCCAMDCSQIGQVLVGKTRILESLPGFGKSPAVRSVSQPPGGGIHAVAQVRARRAIIEY